MGEGKIRQGYVLFYFCVYLEIMQNKNLCSSDQNDRKTFSN